MESPNEVWCSSTQCWDQDQTLQVYLYQMTTQFSILAWEIPLTYEVESYSPWGCKELYTTEQLNNNKTDMKLDVRKLRCGGEGRLISVLLWFSEIWLCKKDLWWGGSLWTYNSWDKERSVPTQEEPITSCKKVFLNTYKGQALGLLPQEYVSPIQWAPSHLAGHRGVYKCV